MSNGAIIKKTYIYENIDLRSVTLVKGGRSTFPPFINDLQEAGSGGAGGGGAGGGGAGGWRIIFSSNLQNQTFILSSVQKIGVLALL